MEEVVGEGGLDGDEKQGVGSRGCLVGQEEHVHVLV